VKKILVIFIALIVIGYLIFSADYFRESSHNSVCEDFVVVIKDSTRTQFVTAKQVEDLVKRYKLHPVGKPFKDINTLAIRDTILNNKLIESADVFITSKATIVATVRQREPVLRVISDMKGSFYVDKDRKIMPISSSFAVYVPIATGVIDEEFAQNELYDFAMFLRNNSSWDAWFEQIVVKKDNEVELIPRAGDFRIIIGNLDDYPSKLNKFVRFVEGGLDVVGWNRYSEINLKYDNQVVCTRK
jgi:cell division protein FtsQ